MQDKHEGREMDHKAVIHSLLKIIAFELLQFVRTAESQYLERWVPIADIKTQLDLNLVAVPQGGDSMA